MSEVLTLLAGVVLLATAVTTAVVAWLTRIQVQEVHVLVNSRMAAMEGRVRQLTAALEGSDTAVPPVPPIDPSR